MRRQLRAKLVQAGFTIAGDVKNKAAALAIADVERPFLTVVACGKSTRLEQEGRGG